MSLTTLNLKVSAILFLLLQVSAAVGQKQSPVDARELPSNQLIEREMTGAETHRYKLKLKANDFFQVRVEQKGIDVVLKLLDKSGHVLATMDSPNGNQGVETFSFVPEKSMSLLLEVSSFDGTAGKGNYTITRIALRKATAIDKRRVDVERIFAAGVKALIVEGQTETALKIFSEAQQGWQWLGDTYMGELTAKLIVGLEIDLLLKLDTVAAFQTALAKVQEAMNFYRGSSDKAGEASLLLRAGHIYYGLGQNAAALQSYDRALSLFHLVAAKSQEASTLGSAGSVFSQLGDQQKALPYFEQALKLYRTIADKRGQASILSHIGWINHLLREERKALTYLDAALRLYEAVGDKTGRAQTLANIGNVFSTLGDNQQALLHLNESLSICRAERITRTEASVLTSIAWVYHKLRENTKALTYLNQALLLRPAVGSKRGEAQTLSFMMVAWYSLGNPRMAVFYGKQAVNKYQEMRQGIQNLDRETQQIFLGNIANAYRWLANILISEGRLLEAEQVLAMLKQDEVFDYLRRDASETDKLAQRADLTEKEKDALKKYKEIANRIAALGEEFNKFRELESKGTKFDKEQARRYQEVTDQIDAANLAFQVFLRGVVEEFAKRTNTEVELRENRVLQRDLKSWGKGVVFLYTLVGEDSYRVILITPNIETDGKSEIKAAVLNGKIELFRQAVQNPNSDPRALGKELYDILIKPIEKQLVGAGADTLLWSLDGNLRLLPLAALWDGKQYFGQKYKNVIVTLGSRTQLGDQATAHWRALALGLSKPKTVKDPNGDGNLVFGALPAVETELLSIVTKQGVAEWCSPGKKFD